METPQDGTGSAGSGPAEPRPGQPHPGEDPSRQPGTDETAVFPPGPGVERPPGGSPPEMHARAVTAWRAFGTWRRSRPFWGGLLLVLAGVELLAIPLLSVLAHGSVKVVIYIGIGGVFGVLIGGLLVACGLLVWFHPVQRVFYAIAGVLLAVASFVATNLGGFFLGMLLGVTGASLSFAWTPGPGRLAGQHRPRPRRPEAPSEGLDLVLDTRPAPERAAERASQAPQEGAGAPGADHEARWAP